MRSIYDQIQDVINYVKLIDTEDQDEQGLQFDLDEVVSQLEKIQGALY
jgi:hypothetical protein